MLAHPRFAVDPEPERQLVRRYGKQRLRFPGKNAASEGDPESPGQFVALARKPFDRVQIEAARGCRSSDLEYDEVAGDAATLSDPIRRCTCDVVRADHRADVDPHGSQRPLRLAEMQDVARIVAVAQEHPRAFVRSQCDSLHLRGGGRGEDISADRPRGESRPDESRKGRVVSRAATDNDSDTRILSPDRVDDAAIDREQEALVRGHQTSERICRKTIGVLRDPRHSSPVPFVRSCR